MPYQKAVLSLDDVQRATELMLQEARQGTESSDRHRYR